MRIRARVRVESKIFTGDRVRVQISVLDRADVTIPGDLRTALHAGNVTDDFTAPSPGRQNFMIRRIGDAVRPETREKRIQEAVEAAHTRRDERSSQNEN